MTELEKLKQWLLSYPNWDAGQLLYIDYTDAVPGNVGLFPKGLEEIGRSEDILGRKTVTCRLRFALYRVTASREDRAADAAWLLDFQNWVQTQSAFGLAPQFGDVPGRERIRAEKGVLKKADQTGTGTYAVVLTAEFAKIYG